MRHFALRTKHFALQRGQILVEVVIAIAVVAFLGATIGVAVSSAIRTQGSAKLRGTAAELAAQAIEAVRIISDSDDSQSQGWNRIYCPPDGQCPSGEFPVSSTKGSANLYGVSQFNNQWKLSGPVDTTAFLPKPKDFSTLFLAQTTFDIEHQPISDKLVIVDGRVALGTLGYVVCADNNCTATPETNRTLSVGGNVSFPRIAFTSVGTPIIFYLDTSISRMFVVVCADLSCATFTKSNISLGSTYTSVVDAITGGDGNVTVISAVGGAAYVVTHCTSVALDCSTWTNDFVSTADEGAGSPIPLNLALSADANRFPVILHETASKVTAVRCKNHGCTGGIGTGYTKQQVVSDAFTAPDSGFIMVPSSDVPVFVYTTTASGLPGSKHVVLCANVSCTGIASNTVLSLSPNSGYYFTRSSRYLRADGAPTFAWVATGKAGIVYCEDIGCTTQKYIDTVSLPDTVDASVFSLTKSDVPILFWLRTDGFARYRMLDCVTPSCSWIVRGGNVYKRFITVENVCRSGGVSTGDITGTGTCAALSYDDPWTQKVTVTVKTQGLNDVVVSQYLTRARNVASTQTSWNTSVAVKGIERMVVWGGTGNVVAPIDVNVLISATEYSGPSQWTQLGTGGGFPFARDHTAVYDNVANIMMVFGGITSAGVTTNQVWLLTNANGIGGNPTWTQATPSGPAIPARYGHTAVYDQAGNRMIVYGGANGATKYNDVWVLQNANSVNSTWQQLAPSGGIAAREEHSAVYDVTNNRMVVFGGIIGATRTSEIWILTNANGLGGSPAWSQPTVNSGFIQGHAFHSAAYDQINNRMMVFGGVIQGSGLDDRVFVLTNASNANGAGVSWTQLIVSGSGPSARQAHAAVYDQDTNRMVIVGGTSGGGFLNDVWRLSNANGLGGVAVWTQDSPTGTFSARMQHTAILSRYPSGPQVVQAFGDTYFQQSNLILGSSLSIVSGQAQGTLASDILDTRAQNGASPNSILWQGTIGMGKIRFQIASSNCANGASNPPACFIGVWDYGADFLGPLGSTANWFEPLAGTPVQICPESAALTSTNCPHWNKRYFRYKVQLCRDNTICTNTINSSPTVTQISINWAR